MRNPFKRKSNPYDAEREHLLKYLENRDPASDDYQKALANLDRLDRIHNRTTELKKTVIPAMATVGGITGIYALQQFAGVIVPKALESIAARQEQKKNSRELD